MTDKQQLFCTEYLKDLNATRAYKEVYKGCKRDETAAQAGSRLLRKVNIKAYIEEKMNEMKQDSIAGAEEVMRYLTSVMRNEITEQVVVVEGCGEGCSEARIVNKDISAKDRNKAAELLGKRYALFTDKVEADVQQQVVFSNEQDLED